MLQVIGQFLVPIRVDVKRVRMNLPVYNGQVLLGFVEFHIRRVGKRIFLAIDHIGFQRHVGFGIGDHLRIGAQRLKGFDGHVNGRCAHLQTFKVFGFGDGPDVVGDVAETAGYAAGRDVKAVLHSGLVDLLAELAAHQRQHLIRVVEEERQGIKQIHFIGPLE